MSGICGLLVVGRDAQPNGIEAMAASLERRGPDGTRIWRGDRVALGHTLLATTPEALVEVLPLTDAETGCTITADARLDNREQLVAELGLGELDRVIGDGELILRAYLRWGEESPANLLGDFAFAIWDPRAQRLFCARDHIGMRQLLYHHEPGGPFVFATEAKAVLAHPEVPRRLNEGRIADFLDDLEGLDLTSTFWESIYRLPPAHYLTVGQSEELVVHRYWRLLPGPRLECGDDEGYAAAFLDVFEEAVRCRLRSPDAVGSMLSGGMDSGSVVAVAAKLLADSDRAPLRTFSAIGPKPESCIETRTILATAGIPGVDPVFLDHADVESDSEALKNLPESGEPFDYHMTLIRAVYLAAHNRGIRIMLDGVGGDVALTAGNRVVQLLRQLRPIAALLEGSAEARFWGPRWPFWKTFPKALWGTVVPAAIRDFRRRLRSRLVDRRIGRGGMISAEFARKVGLPARRADYRRHSPADGLSDVDKRVRSIMHPHLAAARERYDRVASALAIEPRDPFLDVRVLEFCLSLPPEQLQEAGWPKLILRRAMRGLLPNQVIWRSGKEHLGWAFTLALFRSWPGWLQELQSGISAIGAYVPPSLLGPSNQGGWKGLDTEERIKLFFLLSWLRRSGFDRPEAAPTSGIEHVEECT